MPAFLDIVYASDTASINADFLGYSFQGSDLVIGPQGYTDFTASGRIFEADSDGCYLHVQPDRAGNTVFSTDFHGYFPLFYYQSGQHWIISPSFERVAQEAYRRGLPLTPRIHQLEAWKSKAHLLQSTTSARTPFDEIRLLSYDQEIIAGRELSIRQKNRIIASTSYATALADMIALWGGRILTILEGGMAIRADLSGGVDSRTVMAVLYWTLQHANRLELLHSDSVFVNSHPGMTDDYEIATAIGQAFGFPLNNPQRRPYVMTSDEEAFATWKQFNLARYSPHILPLTTLDSNIITFNGLGGGEQRAVYEVYGQGVFGSYLASQRQQFAAPADFQAWLGDTLDDLEIPINAADQKMRAAVRHYRRHRGRHHTAKQPASEFMGVILSSRSAYDCAFHLDTDAINSNQLLFDILINCNEPLTRMPYDQPHKAPQQINFDRLTQLEKIEPAPAGRIWREAQISHPPVKTQGRNIPLRNAVEAALKSPEVRELVGEATLQKLQLQLAKLTPAKNLHQNGHLLHYVLLAEVVSRYRSPRLQTH